MQTSGTWWDTVQPLNTPRGDGGQEHRRHSPLLVTHPGNAWKLFFLGGRLMGDFHLLPMTYLRFLIFLRSFVYVMKQL